jgi:hypothetical protein
VFGFGDRPNKITDTLQFEQTVSKEGKKIVQQLDYQNYFATICGML